MDTGKKLLLIGGGGHCRSILDSVLSMDRYARIGIVDYNKAASSFGIPVIGTDEDLPRLKDEGWTDAFVSVGSTGQTELRRKLYDKLKEIGFAVPVIADPTSSIARNAETAEGVYIGKRAVVNTGAKTGVCAIINTGSVIEHDCIVGDFVHVSPGAVVCGQVSIGNDSHIGAGAVVRQGIRIGKNALIGIGSVVVKDIPDNVKAYGNPCRVAE